MTMWRQRGQMPRDTTPNASQPRLLLWLQTMVVVSVSTAAAVEQYEHDVWTAAQRAPRVVEETQITSQLIQEARSLDVKIDRRGVSSSRDLFAILAIDGEHNESTKDNLTASKKLPVITNGTISSSSVDDLEWRKQLHHSRLNKQVHKVPRFKRSSVTRRLGRLDTGPCEPGWTLRRQWCYKLTNYLRWSEAREQCLSMSASLTTIDSFKKQQDVYDMFAKIRGGWWRAWIGLHRRAGDQWVWDSGQQLTYRNWAGYQPSSMKGEEDCVELHGHERVGWNDVNCNERLPGICEKRKTQTQRAEVRLVGTVNGREHSGMVEVNYGGEWGIVCGDDWDIADARVICRQLGYGDSMNALRNLNAPSSNYFLDDVDCNGSEQSIDQCLHSPWKEHNCGRERAAGVICRGFREACEPGWALGHLACYQVTSWLPWSEARRECLLLNASLTHIDSFEKQQDVYDYILRQPNGGWRAWIGLNRQAGDQWIWDSGQHLTYVNWANKQPDNFKDSEDCVELNARERLGWFDNNCIVELMGICEKQKTQRQRAQVRLVGTVHGQKHSGMVEANYGGKWGIFCDDDWDIADASVICRQLGYSGAIDALVGLNGTSSNFFLDNFHCNGTEQSIDQCDHSLWKEQNCGNGDAAGVICQVARGEKVSCGGLVHSPAVITSPGFPQPYPVDRECRWTIQAVSDNNSVLLEFWNLSMTEFDDYLIISDGSEFQYTFTGEVQPHDLLLRPPVEIIFVASNWLPNVNYTGFNITIRHVAGRAPRICRSGHWVMHGDLCMSVLWYIPLVSWTEGRSLCRSMGGLLVEPDDDEKLQTIGEFLAFHAAKTKEVWIGLKRGLGEEGWMWDTGRSLTFSNWAAGKPHEAASSSSCAALDMEAFSGAWIDDECDAPKAPMCTLLRRNEDLLCHTE